MANRTVSRGLSSLLVLGGLFSQLVACGGGTTTPTDAGPVDTGSSETDAFVERDAATRDTGARVDSGIDTYDLQQTAEMGLTTAFCTCYVSRNPDTTMADCLMANEGDPIIDTCDELGYRATAGLFDRYAYCRAEALDAATACIAASDCSEAAVMTCQGPLTTANMTTCPAFLTDPGREAYTPPYTMCIEEMLSGPPGECPETLTAVSTVGAAVFMGTTDLQGDDTNPDCDDTTGYAPDRGYLWAAPAAGTYTIDTIGSEFDTILYVRDECLSATSIACNDDIEAGVMRQSTLEVTLTAGQEVVIIVDGWENEHGNFVVNITPGATSDAGVGADAAVDVDAATGMDAGVDAG